MNTEPKPQLLSYYRRHTGDARSAVPHGRRALSLAVYGMVFAGTALLAYPLSEAYEDRTFSLLGIGFWLAIGAMIASVVYAAKAFRRRYALRSAASAFVLVIISAIMLIYFIHQV